MSPRCTCTLQQLKNCSSLMKLLLLKGCWSPALPSYQQNKRQMHTGNVILQQDLLSLSSSISTCWLSLWKHAAFLQPPAKSTEQPEMQLKQIGKRTGLSFGSCWVTHSHPQLDLHLCDRLCLWAKRAVESCALPSSIMLKGGIVPWGWSPSPDTLDFHYFQNQHESV